MLRPSVPQACAEEQAPHDWALTWDSGIAGIAVFTYLTAAIYKCNEVIKKEVALKSESSRFMVTVLGSIAVLQGLSFLTVLYRQELWLNLILIPRQGSVKGVSTAHPRPSSFCAELYAACLYDLLVPCCRGMCQLVTTCRPK